MFAFEENICKIACAEFGVSSCLRAAHVVYREQSRAVMIKQRVITDYLA